MKDKLLVLLIVLGCSACGEYEVLEVTKKCHRMADSLYFAHKDSLTKEFNKQCSDSSEVYYQLALDSLTRTRISDIKNLIEK